VFASSGSNGATRAQSLSRKVSALKASLASQDRQIAQECPKPLQAAKLPFRGSLACLAPLRSDPAIDQVQGRVGQPHQLQAQEAGQFKAPARFSDRQQRSRLAGYNPVMEMFQAGQWQILNRQTVGTQFPQEAHFGQMVVQFRCRLFGWRRPQPFQPRRLTIRNRFQQLLRPGVALRFVCHGTNGINQDRFLIAQRPDRVAAQLAFGQQQIAMIDQPDTGFGGEIGAVIKADGFPPQKSSQPAQSVFWHLAPPQQRACRRLVLEERPPAPVKRADRGNARRCASDDLTQMRENRRRHEFNRVQQASRHLQEADL
jgi:hypothetical protein